VALQGQSSHRFPFLHTTAAWPQVTSQEGFDPVEYNAIGKGDTTNRSSK
jgi:hypothetical protein